MSKDGYETEVTRVQSKRNLFKFIKSYLVKETNFVPHPEDFWWKRGVTRKRHYIEESFQQYFLNSAPVQEQEDFAYEGIFDKKNDKSPLKIANNRMDVSNFINTLNRSKMVDEEHPFRHNASQLVHIQDEVSNNSFSPNSANSHAFLSKMKQRDGKIAIYQKLN